VANGTARAVRTGSENSAAVVYGTAVIIAKQFVKKMMGQKYRHALVVCNPT
jgi:hypothetical protein